MKKQLSICAVALFFNCFQMSAQETSGAGSQPKEKPKVLYGKASFYANKFEGRRTANGEIFSQKKLTAACNVLPLGSWIRVTNLRNRRSVVVKINDHLHYRMKRLVDLSRAAALRIGHRDGLIRVKVELLAVKNAGE